MCDLLCQGLPSDANEILNGKLLSSQGCVNYRICKLHAERGGDILGGPIMQRAVRRSFK